MGEFLKYLQWENYYIRMHENKIKAKIMTHMSVKRFL